jgi:hypothetical protein
MTKVHSLQWEWTDGIEMLKICQFERRIILEFEVRRGTGEFGFQENLKKSL